MDVVQVRALFGLPGRLGVLGIVVGLHGLQVRGTGSANVAPEVGKEAHDKEGGLGSDAPGGVKTKQI